MSGTLRNGGQDVELEWAAGGVVLLGGPLPYTYALSLVHVKFGLEERSGSAHALDGRHFAGEACVLCAGRSLSATRSGVSFQV